MRLDDTPMYISPGERWDRTITVYDDNGQPADLTGYSVYCQIRTGPGGELLAEPDVTINAGLGQISLALMPDETREIGVESGKYDIVIVEDMDADNIVRLVKGTVYFEPLITDLVGVVS